MWTVIYHNAIEVKILDQDWLNDFQSGKSYAQAPPRSKLIVDLIQTVPVNEEGIQTGKPKYTINKVHNVVLPPERLPLGDS